MYNLCYILLSLAQEWVACTNSVSLGVASALTSDQASKQREKKGPLAPTLWRVHPADEKNCSYSTKMTYLPSPGCSNSGKHNSLSSGQVTGKPIALSTG